MNRAHLQASGLKAGQRVRFNGKDWWVVDPIEGTIVDEPWKTDGNGQVVSALTGNRAQRRAQKRGRDV